MIDALQKFYGTLPRPPRDPFTLFVWEVLSVHSTPRKRDAALAALKRIRALTPDAMWRAPQKKLEESVRLAGPYLEQRVNALRTGVEIFRRALLEARSDSLEPVRILVAEDDQDFRDLLQLVLAREFPGADVECVADGRQAIAAFDRKPASVMVLDLQMPELDGMAVTALLRARPQALQVPIIVLSASGGSKEWQLLSSLGADRFLVKPVNLDDVISTIRRVTRERTSRSAPPPVRPMS